MSMITTAMSMIMTMIVDGDGNGDVDYVCYGDVVGGKDDGGVDDR